MISHSRHLCLLFWIARTQASWIRLSISFLQRERSSMPLDNYGFSTRFGWLNDGFGETRGLSDHGRFNKIRRPGMIDLTAMHTLSWRTSRRKARSISGSLLKITIWVPVIIHCIKRMIGSFSSFANWELSAQARQGTISVIGSHAFVHSQAWHLTSSFN